MSTIKQIATDAADEFLMTDDYTSRVECIEKAIRKSKNKLFRRIEAAVKKSHGDMDLFMFLLTIIKHDVPTK